MEYDIKMIRTLCDKYFDGRTSAEEERTLKSYFTKVQDIPGDLKAVKVMICGMDEASNMAYVPAAAEPVRVGRMSMKVRRIIWSTIAAAASVAVCFSLFNREVYGYDAEGNAITDPQVALESTVLLSHLSKLETTIDIAEMITMEMEKNN